MNKIDLHKTTNYNVDTCIKVDENTFDALEESIYMKELIAYKSHQKMFQQLKEDNPKMYQFLKYKMLSKYEVDWLEKGILRKEFIKETYETRQHSCDRTLKNGEHEDGLFTAISIMNNEINEKITRLQLQKIFGCHVEQNKYATHGTRDHTNQNHANSNPDYILFLPSGQKVLLELQTSFKDNNKLEHLDMKLAKLNTYKKQIRNFDLPVIHCEKVNDLKHHTVKFYIFDTTKLFNKNYLLLNSRNISQYTDKEEYSQQVHKFQTAGKRPWVFFDNLQDCGQVVSMKDRVDLTEIIENKEKYCEEIKNKTNTKAVELTTSMGDLLKNISIDTLLADAEKKVKPKGNTTRNTEKERE